MSSVPTIRISFGYLFYESESKALAEKFGLELKDRDYYHDKTYKYWQEWQKNGEQILHALQDALGVTFHLPIIDVTCIPFFIPKANPVIMNFKDTPERFVDVLTHELCHLLLTDNNRHQEYEEAPGYFVSQDWKKMFGSGHSHSTLVHIPVHALCKYLWLDVLQDPKKVEADIEATKSWKGGEHYLKSWDYVNNNDYKEIVKRLKEPYVEKQA